MNGIAIVEDVYWVCLLYTVLVLIIIIIEFIKYKGVLKMMEKTTEKRKNQYIYTGYETRLKKILESKAYKVILINGKYGIGKTSFLNNVLQSMEFKEKRKKKFKKEFKIYEEFVETNYIDYMYNSLKEEECVIKKNITVNVGQMLYVLIAVVIIGLEIFVKKSTEISMNIFIMMMIFASILLFIKKKFERNKVNKIKYIRKRVSLYKYIIIDDLDREYIENKEILKMIHFLQELDSDCKIILLGDRNNFISSDNNLDMLEKYYDYVFEINKEIISKFFCVELKKSLEKKIPSIENIDSDKDNPGLSLILKIILDYEVRTIKKILEYINSLDEEELKRIQNELHLSDYIMVVVIYYADYQNYEDLFEIFARYSSNINNKKLIWDEGVRKQVENAKNEIETLNLNEKIKQYILEIFPHENDLEDTLTNRIVNKPSEYKINVFESDSKRKNYKIKYFINN